MNGSSRSRDLAPVFLVAISGWLCARAYPDAARPELAWVALVPFLLCVRASTVPRALFLGAWWMLCFAWGINDWFPTAVSRYLARPLPVGFAFFLGVTLGSAAPATMMFALFYRRWGRRASALAPLAAAAAWVATEYFRSEFLGDPWGLLGYSQALRPVWIQVADFAGVYGVSFVVLFVNAAVAESLIAIAGARLTPSFLAVLLATTAAVPGFALMYGRRALDAPATGSPGIDVAVVQGDIDIEAQWPDVMHGPNLAKYLEMTRQVLEAGGARLVVWPENAVTFFLDEAADRRASIAATLEPYRASLLTGGPYRDRDRDGAYLNSAFLVSPDGTVVARYDKRRLLPFGEYQPVGSLAMVSGRFDRVQEFQAGREQSGILDVDGTNVGMVICNEAMFAEPARESVAAGAGVLFALTNDSWVGERKFAEQALEKAVLRAVEQRRALVRASTSGPSAIVDAEGRVTARTEFGREATLVARVETSEVRSVYSRIGDVFAWACSALFVLWWPGRRREETGA